MAPLARRVRAEDWRPIGIDELEPNAFDVVRSSNNRSVIAGPGAGKTELLAQRAAYLLQTGAAPTPRRILAISYKRDAAANLASRVRKRCHRTHAARLDSLTFDSFAKSLVDRFGQALPEHWRPTHDYEISFPDDKLYEDFLLRQVPPPPAALGTAADVRAIATKDFERDHLLGRALPADDRTPRTSGEWAARHFWRSSLNGGKRSHLSFAMIGRLAELLLRVNPMVRDALRLTYSHLFMDEFQDTTQVQYDLVRTIFEGTSAVITAVGDNKQQIMRWAMAMPKPFAHFVRDFGAVSTPLLNNYRSSPELVRIQHVLAQALDPRAAKPVSKTSTSVSGDSCEIWDFTTPQAEADHVAAYITAEMRAHALAPRDFVLLVRQVPQRYANVLGPAFARVGLSLRNEAATLVDKLTLQDLLADETSGLLLGILRLAMTDRAGRYWTECQASVADLRGVSPDDEAGQARLARELDAFALGLKKRYAAPPTSRAGAGAVVTDVVEFIGRERLLAAHPAYAQGAWFGMIEEGLEIHLAASGRGAADWTAALDAYEGVSTVPLMTIHKSKGLEYHSVLFVGLDDGAWERSFKQDRAEATAGFFVAFTRAKQRVLFTYCAQRGTRKAIASLYQLLHSAGVKSRMVA